MDTNEQIVATVDSILKQYGDKAPGKSVRIMIEVPLGKLGMFRVV